MMYTYLQIAMFLVIQTMQGIQQPVELAVQLEPFPAPQAMPGQCPWPQAMPHRYVEGGNCAMMKEVSSRVTGPLTNLNGVMNIQGASLPIRLTCEQVTGGVVVSLSCP